MEYPACQVTNLKQRHWCLIWSGFFLSSIALPMHSCILDDFLSKTKATIASRTTNDS